MASLIQTFAERASRDRENITPELFDELERYVQHGIPPSQFVRYVLLNDLFGAARQASPVNQAILCWLALFVVRHVPWRARLKEENLRAWVGIDNLPEGTEGVWS